MIKKKVTAFLVIIAAFLLQTTVFQSLALADVVPNLLLVVTVTYAYLRGRTSGILIGFFCGMLLDMGYGSVIGLYALAFLTIGFLVGFCQKIYFRESLILPAVLITVSDLLYGIYYYITEFLVRAKLNFGFYFLHIILPEAIYTAIVGILVFRLLVALEHTITSRREEVEF
jgi:rod shape-determining protein MreD